MAPFYPRKDLNLHGYEPTKLKLALSTIPALGLFYEVNANERLALPSIGHEPTVFTITPTRIIRLK